MEVSKVTEAIEDDKKTSDKSDASIAEGNPDKNYVSPLKSSPKLQVTPRTSSFRKSARVKAAKMCMHFFTF